MDWHFTDMEFSITQKFVRLGSFMVLAGQKATIHVPIARAEATATFGITNRTPPSRRPYLQDM
jgi:hypothetical protein